MKFQLLVMLSLAAGAAAFAPGGVRLAAAPKLMATAPRVSRSGAPTLVFSPRAAASRALTPLTRRGAEASAAAVEEDPAGKGLLSLFVNLFPVWTVLGAGVALAHPPAFTWLTTKYFTAALAMLMVSMGITLTPKDFQDVVKNPTSTGIQFAMCYGMMPLLAFSLGKAFGLPAEIVAGMVLVGSINGGQASNLCTYIAKGNVAMSVVMTTATTLGAILFTPLLCKTLLGTVVPVDARGIAMSTLQVVLGPIVVGMTARKVAPKPVAAFMPFAPVVGVIATVLLVGSAVAQVKDPILNAGWALQAAVLSVHLIGGLIGYFVPKALGYGETTCRTMAIETSMKSSAFGFLLAKLHFAAFLTRVPSAVSVVWMAVTGSTLGVIWKYIPVDESKEVGKK